MKESNRIQTALRNRERLDGEIVGLRKQLEESGSRLAALEDTANLADKIAIGQIIELQAVVALLPRRIAAREGVRANATSEVVAACHAEIESYLGPRGREVERAVQAKVRAALAPHFADEGELARAVEASDLVRKVRVARGGMAIRTPVGIEVGGDDEVGYAQKVLAAREQLAVLAKQVG